MKKLLQILTPNVVKGIGVGLILSAAVILGVAALRTKPVTVKLENIKYGAIVRLHDKESGRFFCSGTVVGLHQVFTAAHCTQFVGYTVDVRPSNGLSIGNYAVVEAMNARGDVAMLKGNFSQFDIIPMEQNPAKIVEALKSNNLMLCGYPWSGKLYCNRFDYKGPYVFQLGGLAYAYPGMSGGPLLDLETGKVIGCTSNVTETGLTNISPAVEIDALLSN